MRLEARIKFNREETRPFAALFRWTDAEDITPVPTYPDGKPAIPFHAVAQGTQLDRNQLHSLAQYIRKMKSELACQVEYWKLAKLPQSGIIGNPEVVKRALVESREQAVEEAITCLAHLATALSHLRRVPEVRDEGDDEDGETMEEQEKRWAGGHYRPS